MNNNKIALTVDSDGATRTYLSTNKGYIPLEENIYCLSELENADETILKELSVEEFEQIFRVGEPKQTNNFILGNFEDKDFEVGTIIHTKYYDDDYYKCKIASNKYLTLDLDYTESFYDSFCSEEEYREELSFEDLVNRE